MVTERIIDWVLEQGSSNSKKVFDPKLPANINYYRDGVSDAQYPEVKDVELPAIQNALIDAVNWLRKEGYINDNGRMPTVNITAMICVKRHGVRFYPILSKDTDRHGNCPPGTQVESVVTSPFFNDFYLQSHAAIKGTAKPCHYFVLCNDMKMCIQNISTLTQELCYTYVHALCGVSYASPIKSRPHLQPPVKNKCDYYLPPLFTAYYADRLCERGRIYLRNLYQRTPEGKQIRYDFDDFKNDQENLRQKQ